MKILILATAVFTILGGNFNYATANQCGDYTSADSCPVGCTWDGDSCELASN